MIGFGNPELFPLLNGKVNLHVDRTFFCVLHPLTQLIASMMCDVQTEMHVPILHVLVSGEQRTMVSCLLKNCDNV